MRSKKGDNLMYKETVLEQLNDEYNFLSKQKEEAENELRTAKSDDLINYLVFQIDSLNHRLTSIAVQINERRNK
jgi:hypothetical protein